MRITWPVSSIFLLTLPLACSTTVPQDTEPQTTSGATDDDNDDDDDASATVVTKPPTTGDMPTGDVGETTLDPSGVTSTQTSIGDTSDSGSTAEVSSTPPDTGSTETDSASVSESASNTDPDTDTTVASTESSSTGGPQPTCDDGQANGGESDVDCGGPDCNACDDDKACVDAGDCSSSVCVEGTCAAPTCIDAAMNQDETDVDCGGGCPQCTDGGACIDSGDCDSGVCAMDFCQPATCEDNAFNQDESDIDCGGEKCDPCDDGKDCLVSADCASQVCKADICAAPTCSDGAQNQDETDVDCGGAMCASCQLGHLVINEVDYDQTGNDTLEFIEIYNNTGLPVSLLGVKVVLVNGDNNMTYANIDLSGQVSLAQGQYLVVANPGVVVPAEALKVNLANNTIQNGAPDGIALVDSLTMQLIDALSYEGSITSATVTGIGAGVDLVEGSAFTPADAGNGLQSIARFPNGNDKDDAKTDFVLSKNPTPGAANLK